MVNNADSVKNVCKVTLLQPHFITFAQKAAQKVDKWGKCALIERIPGLKGCLGPLKGIGTPLPVNLIFVS